MFVDFLPSWGFDGGSRQSPISIKSNGVFTGDPVNPPFKLNPNGSLTGDPRLTPIYKELQWEFDQRREGEDQTSINSLYPLQYIPLIKDTKLI